jgi:transposase
MAGRLVTDELWSEIESLFPEPQRSAKGGRPPIANRDCFTCLLFMLKTGIGWRDLPTELGASISTVRRRLKYWTEIGLWPAIHKHLLTHLRAWDAVDLAEVLIDGGLIKAPCGGEKLVPTQPTEGVAVVN